MTRLILRMMPLIVPGKKNIPIGEMRRSCRLSSKTSINNESNNKVVCDTIKPVKVKRPLKIDDEEFHKNNSINYSAKIEKKIKSEPNIENDDIKDSKKTILNKNDVCDSNYVTSNNLPKPDEFIDVESDELDLERTLLGGQTFRFRTDEIYCNDGKKTLIFTGIILDYVIKIWRISDKQIAYKLLNKTHSKNLNMKEILIDYFQLKYNLKELYEEWSKRDEHVAKCCEQYKGFRILRQDPAENVFSFICATNNNIKRISQMVSNLCIRFGKVIKCDELDSKSINDSYHSFPTVERLAEDDVFQCLRYELGFGYRAKFINETAKELIKLTKEIKQEQMKEADDCNFDLIQKQERNFTSAREYLLSLRNLTYKETCKQLMKFPGIGRKVADCICLMSMDHLNSVPIDCHIYEVVCRNYMPNLRNERKTLTDSVHDLIGDYFKNLHGNLAGWSTSVLFIAELKHLKLNDEKIKKKSKTTNKKKKA